MTFKAITIAAIVALSSTVALAQSSGSSGSGGTSGGSVSGTGSGSGSGSSSTLPTSGQTGSGSGTSDNMTTGSTTSATGTAAGITGTQRGVAGSLDTNADGTLSLSELQSATMGRSDQERRSVMAGLNEQQRQQLRTECGTATSASNMRELCQSLNTNQ